MKFVIESPCKEYFNAKKPYRTKFGERVPYQGSKSIYQAKLFDTHVAAKKALDKLKCIMDTEGFEIRRVVIQIMGQDTA